MQLFEDVSSKLHLLRLCIHFLKGSWTFDGFCYYNIIHSLLRMLKMSMDAWKTRPNLRCILDEYGEIILT